MKNIYTSFEGIIQEEQLPTGTFGTVYDIADASLHVVDDTPGLLLSLIGAPCSHHGPILLNWMFVGGFDAIQGLVEDAGITSPTLKRTQHGETTALRPGSLADVLHELRVQRVNVGIPELEGEKVVLYRTHDRGIGVSVAGFNTSYSVVA